MAARSIALALLRCLIVWMLSCRLSGFLSPRQLPARRFTQLMSQRPLVVVIAGPTASGKSDVAAEICDVIVSADSVQAYRGVNIGANKPTAAERMRTPHLLVDVADASMNYNAANWTRDALFCIRNIINDSDATQVFPFSDSEPDDSTETTQVDREKIRSMIHQVKEKSTKDKIVPVVVGGTMMYIQWLVHGRPDAVKPTEAALSNAAKDMSIFEKAGDWEGAKKHVASQGDVFVAPVAKLFPNDWYRLRRILEVALSVQKDDDDALQKLYSGLRNGGLSSSGLDVRCFFLCPDERMAHTKVIDGRCEDMICRGLIKETTDLVLAGEMPEMAAKAIGYRQTLEYLQRDSPKDEDSEAFQEFLANFTGATRRYAKRQMQWFRRDQEFMFVPVPVSVPKAERVKCAADEVKRILALSREEYDKERLDPESLSAQARTKNELQGKKMKFYQFQLQRLKPGSNDYKEALSEADACAHKLQSKKLKTSA